MTPGSVLGGCGFESPLGQSFSPPVINESQLVDSASSPEEDGGGGGGGGGGRKKYRRSVCNKPVHVSDLKPTKTASLHENLKKKKKKNKTTDVKITHKI